MSLFAKLVITNSELPVVHESTVNQVNVMLHCASKEIRLGNGTRVSHTKQRAYNAAGY